MSSRRGITGRLFQAGRKYFSTGSSGGKSSSNIRQISVQPSPLNYNRQTMQIYPYSSPEAILRRLADFSFMLGDFKFSQIVYETIKKDFQSEKAHRYFASAQEMIGLCQIAQMMQPHDPTSTSGTLTLGGGRKDVDSIFESAISTYLEQGYARDAFRASLIYHKYFKDLGQEREAARVLIRMVNEVSVPQSALLYEQAAYCCRGMQPIAYSRKYSLYLYLASEKYLASSEIENALRCLCQSLEIYKGKNWSLIEDSINYQLASLNLQQGHTKESLQYALLLLKQSKSSAKHQELYLKFFTAVYKQFQKEFPAEDLQSIQVPLPEIKISSLRVFATPTQRLASTISFTLPIAENDDLLQQWRLMEKDFAKSTVDTSKLSFALREPVSICVQIQNPLAVQLALDRLDLSCTFTPAAIAPVSSPTSSDLKQQQQLLDESADGKYAKHSGYWIEKRPGIMLMPYDIVEV
jgi:trafficking protein particle complex subunit 8